MTVQQRRISPRFAVVALFIVLIISTQQWDLEGWNLLPVSAHDYITALNATYNSYNISSISSIATRDPLVMETMGAVENAATGTSSDSPSLQETSTISTGGTATASYIDAKIASVLETFEKRKLRYYMYEDPRFDQLGAIYLPFYKSFKEFAITEEEILEVMKNHSLRTLNPEEANWYIVPFSLQRHLIHIMTREAGLVFGPLFNQTIFQKLQGHRHLMLAQNPNMFSIVHAKMYRVARLTQQYPQLYNVTIARSVDADGCQESIKSGFISPTNDFGNVMIGCGKHATRSSFSTGFVPQRSFTYLPATYEKFMNSTVHVFYHSRIEPSWNNSTQYRHALLNESIIQAMSHNSSIGFDMEPNEWFRTYTNSRFCMVIRGDNPTSRAHLRTIKIGCIPVIVSDTISYYAPAFKSSISVSDYAVMIDEAAFLKDPMGSLSVLTALTDDEIRGKMKALAFAQRLLLPDHPESLFVPALLWESEVAYARRLNSTRYPWKTVGANNPRGPK